MFNKLYDSIMTWMDVNYDDFRNCDLKEVVQIVETRTAQKEF